MDTTPNLSLPYIMAAQAQKHVTHNEAIRALDALVQLTVLDRDLAAPPPSPADGARYIVAASATGAWLGQDGRIAAFQDGAWIFHSPLEGWVAWIADEDKLVAWDGAAWIVAGDGGGSVNPTPLVGVNATADTTNRLAVSSPASLLNHEGTGHQLKINKAAAANTASLMFQDGFSGRAEFGLTGDDDFHVKVSADGAIWREALVVNKTSGNIGLGTASPNALLHIRGDGSNFNQGLRIENAAGTTDHFDLMAGWGGNYDGEMHFAFNGVSIARLNAFGLSTSPGKNFFITGDGGFISYNDGATGAYMNSGAYLQLQGRDYVRFDVYYSEKMRVLGNGNVGIGTATPACTLDVAGPIRCGSYTVATVPSASIAGAGAQIYVSNESGGAVPAFSDGTSWRRVTDRAVVS